MIRLTVVVDIDPDSDDNTYRHSALDANIVESISRGHVKPGESAYLEFGTGDVAEGNVVSVTADRVVG